MRQVVREPVRVGRYELFDAIAAGGMATVHLARVRGASDFARVVAVKRPHPHLVREKEFASMLMDEARVASKIRDAHVVPTLDVVAEDGELLLVMEYVHGVSLAELAHAAYEADAYVPVPVATAIVRDVLRGLHAAHTARGADGEPLEIVHRDVSPQNVLVGADGVARVVDFGIARARGRSTVTAEGLLRGKLAYMAPEQARRAAVTARTDIYAAGVVLWETLTGRRLFMGEDDVAVLEQVLIGLVRPPSRHVPSLAPAVDDIVLRALSTNAAERYASAAEMADALEAATPLASPAEIAAWVRQACGAELDRRAEQVAAVERSRVPRGPRAPSWALRRVAALGIGATMALTILGLSVTLVKGRTASAEERQPIAAGTLADPVSAPVAQALSDPPLAASAERPEPAAAVADKPKDAPRTPAKAAKRSVHCALRTVDAQGITRYHPECLN